MMEEQLTQIKQEYVPKPEYTLHIGITSDNKILGAVFKKTEIRSYRRGTSDIAEASIFNGKAPSKEEFAKMFDKYITKRI